MRLRIHLTGHGQGKVTNLDTGQDFAPLRSLELSAGVGQPNLITLVLLADEIEIEAEDIEVVQESGTP
jgi:hypothetical protein